MRARVVALTFFYGAQRLRDKAAIWTLAYRASVKLRLPREARYHIE
eukprot:UN01089